MEFCIILWTITRFLALPAFNTNGQLKTLLGLSALSTPIVYTIALAVFLILYLLKTITLYTMAKNRELRKEAKFAFLPVASTILMGRLAENDARKNKKIMKFLVNFFACIEVFTIVFFGAFLLITNTALQQNAFQYVENSVINIKITNLNLFLMYTIVLYPALLGFLFYFFLSPFLYYAFAKNYFPKRLQLIVLMVVIGNLFLPFVWIFFILKRKTKVLSPDEYVNAYDANYRNKGRQTRREERERERLRKDAEFKERYYAEKNYSTKYISNFFDTVHNIGEDKIHDDENYDKQLSKLRDCNPFEDFSDIAETVYHKKDINPFDDFA